MSKTVAEQTYETITALTSGGMKKADAIRKVAADQGKKEGAVRANYYNHARKLAGPQPARTATTGLSAEEAVSGARDLLQQALEAIDRELGAAKSVLDDAQARYEQLASSAAKRKRDLERKLKALDA